LTRDPRFPAVTDRLGQAREASFSRQPRDRAWHHAELANRQERQRAWQRVLELVLSQLDEGTRLIDGHALDIDADDLDRGSADGKTSIINHFADERAAAEQRNADFGVLVADRHRASWDKPLGIRRDQGWPGRDRAKHHDTLRVRTTVDR